MTDPHPSDLAEKALRLAGDSADKLERWLALFETRLAQAEASATPCELKEFVACTAALERTLKIARLAQMLRPADRDGAEAALDPEELRRLLEEEE